ncbi:N-acetyltransferase [Plasmodium gonderi]|uniref:N-acetyltransferase n=1 Tax=Plasmodium gonderi TaxID=77519 RepID=A0A1Y1JGV1_PLAGO|nr:N-acetyltransferase [Plasmodium gonderi]GAW81741.1 N-acetyltransferase [Plasmodium gonderi]
MENCKKKNIPVINDHEYFKNSYIDVLNKKRVLYKYVFLFNNYKFKFKIISTYYEYLTVCNNLLRDVTTCNLFFGPLIFFEMLGKSFYYPYVLYIYDKDSTYSDKCPHLRSLKFEKSSILSIEHIIKKGKEKNDKYFRGKINYNEKIILDANDIPEELKNYNLDGKYIVGYTEMYLLFHMGRSFDSRIERLVVDKYYRNKGFGLLIMYISIYVLKYLYQCNRCDLNVENDIALRIYKKLNFFKVETQVYRLNLHCNYDYLPNDISIQNDTHNIQSFMDNITAKK